MAEESALATAAMHHEHRSTLVTAATPRGLRISHARLIVRSGITTITRLKSTATAITSTCSQHILTTTVADTTARRSIYCRTTTAAFAELRDEFAIGQTRLFSLAGVIRPKATSPQFDMPLAERIGDA